MTVDELPKSLDKRVIPFVADAYLDRRRPEWVEFQDKAWVLYVR